MSVLYWLENLRCPVLDFFFSTVTLFGEETLVVVIAMILFWCFDKKQGYFLFFVSFFGTVCNLFLKAWFRVPRPWVKDPSFTVVEAAKEGATGYSFPSGHTQSSVVLYSSIIRWNKQKWLRAGALALCVLVPFSRLYLGVHTLQDVLVSVAISLVLVLVCTPLFQKHSHKKSVMFTLLGFLLACTLALVAFLNCYNFPAEEANSPVLAHIVENAYTLLGCILGLIVVYFADVYGSRFSTKGVWWVQLIKIAGGLLLVLGAKELPKELLNSLLPLEIARVVRYFLLVTVGGALWPFTFKYWNKLANKRK